MSLNCGVIVHSCWLSKVDSSSSLVQYRSYVQFSGSVHMDFFFLYMNWEAYLVVITGEHCIQEWLYTQGWSLWQYYIHDYWAMSAPQKGDALICADLFMSLHIFQFQFSWHPLPLYLISVAKSMRSELSVPDWIMSKWFFYAKRFLIGLMPLYLRLELGV